MINNSISQTIAPKHSRTIVLLTQKKYVDNSKNLVVIGVYRQTNFFFIKYLSINYIDR